MTRHVLTYVLVALLSGAPVAQQAPQTSTPASQPPGAAMTVPAEQPSTSILPDGTPLKLRLLNKLDSKTAKNGEEIPFDVVNDVVVGGVTVLRRGAPATGVVTQATGSKTMGRAGRLSFTIDPIKLQNGADVPVRAFNRTSGENRTGEMIADMLVVPIAAAPFFLLIHGTDTVFPRGTEITAFVNGDLRLNLVSFRPTPSASTAADELKTVLKINSTPDGAQVEIDGVAAGNTPLKVTLTGGKHEISIKKDGYSEWRKSLNLGPDMAQVDAVLQPPAAQ